MTSIGAPGCPRCGREPLHPARFCVGCGAPLLLGDETLRPIEAALDLDRRVREPASGPAGRALADRAVAAVAAAPPAAAGAGRGAGEAAAWRGELAALARSHWDVAASGDGSPVAREPEGAAWELAPPGAPEWPQDDPALPDAEVDALEVHVERPPSWRRAAAWAVDGLPFLAAGAALGRTLLREVGAVFPAGDEELDVLLDLLARERVIVLSVAAAVALALAVYATVSHALAGATLGKRLLRVRVIGPDGGRPSPARSAVRSGLALVSAALFGLGFVVALFTRSGRGLHDLIARTWVVKAP